MCYHLSYLKYYHLSYLLYIIYHMAHINKGRTG